jgi:hypothetical protein
MLSSSASAGVPDKLPDRTNPVPAVTLPSPPSRSANSAALAGLPEKLPQPRKSTIPVALPDKIRHSTDSSWSPVGGQITALYSAGDGVVCDYFQLGSSTWYGLDENDTGFTEKWSMVMAAAMSGQPITVEAVETATDCGSGETQVQILVIGNPQ